MKNWARSFIPNFREGSEHKRTKGTHDSGAGITSFLLVAVSVIELLDFEFSAIVGLPVGLLAEIVGAVGLWSAGTS
jgi:hypothetical protein